MLVINHKYHKGELVMKFNERESANLEFKAEIPKNNQIIKTIVGFCNQYGGKLILGIDNSGRVIGLNEDAIEQAREYLEKSIFEATAPSILPLVYTQLLGDKLVLVIEVSAGMNKPYYIRSEGLDRGVYVRLGRSTIRATPDMIEELRWQSRGRDFDKMAVYNASEEDLDKKAVTEFLAERKSTRKVKLSVEPALLAYNLLTIEHAQKYPTTAGLLLFGKEPQQFFDYAIILCAHFSGITGREAIASKDCIGRLIDQYYSAYEFILNTLHKSFTIRGKIRSEQLEIPEIAIREVLINAIVHRNYHIRSPIKIAIYENRIEIYSPGIFPGPMAQYGLLSGTTFWRNTVICKVFRELGLIELMGSGFIELFRSYKERGLDAPKVIEGEGFIKCILPRPSMRRMQKLSIRSHQDEVRYCEILDLFQNATALSISDIIHATTLSRTTTGRRLAELIRKGTLRKTGQGRGTRYYLIC